MELNAFAEFAIVISLAAVLGIIATYLRQPPILGYILTGLVIGTSTQFLQAGSGSIELLSKVGIAFLLFTLGLELDISQLRKLGKVALATGLGQIVFTSIFGYLLSIMLGFDSIASLYIAIGLTFSSTIVIVKLLSAKNQLDSLFGRISVGFLLVQDFVAIIILIGLTAFRNIKGESIEGVFYSIGQTLLVGAIVGLVIYAFVKLILNPILNSIRHEKEVLFLAAISWALALAAILGSKEIGFSIEVGGLIAGIALSNRFEHLQIESWTKPLRDFFLTLFFVLLGAHIQVDSINNALFPAIVMSVFVLVGNPLIVMIIMGLLGYNKKIGFMTSLAVAQISEFSLILMNFAYSELKQVNNEEITMMTLVGGITMTISSYMIYYNEQIYEKIKDYLSIFEFKKGTNQEDESQIKDNKSIILFGCHRMGRNLLKLIKSAKDDLLVIDFDPRNIGALRNEGFDAIYGDMSDISRYDEFGLEKADIIISTVPSFKENKTLLNYISELKDKPLMIITSSDGATALQLYKLGADFVVYPHLLGSEILTQLVSKKTLTKRLVLRRRRHMELLNSM